MPMRPMKIVAQEAPPRATAARCSTPSRPAMMVSTVTDPITAKLAMKIGPARRASPESPMLGRDRPRPPVRVDADTKRDP